MSETQSTMSDSTTDDESNRINEGREMELANPEDVLFVKRDGEGDVLPVKQQVPGRDVALRVIPPTEGRWSKYLENEEELYEDNEKFAELLNKSFPDLDPITGDDLADGLLPFGARSAVAMIKDAAGKDMLDGLNERQMEENKQVMEMLSGEEGNLDMRELVELGQEMEEGDEQAADARAQLRAQQRTAANPESESTTPG